MSVSYDFTGKVVLVTGSSSGIGEDLVINFSKCGASVVVHGRNQAKVDEVAQKCQEVSPTGKQPLKFVSNITDDEAAKELVEQTVHTFGKLDILVNNAGMAGVKQIEDDDFMQEFDAIMNTNFRSAVLVTKLCVPHLVTSKGNIINVASTTSVKPVSIHKVLWTEVTLFLFQEGSLPIYASSKAALDMMSKCLAVRLSPKGVRVNSVM